jgi:CRISPR-associated protein Cmr2
MKYEFLAEFSGQWDRHGDKDEGSQIILLCEALPDKRTKTNSQKRLRECILEGKLNKYLRKQKEKFQSLILFDLPSLDGFPLGSFSLQFTFILDKPYVSLDDTPLYILDNPLKKEKIFKLPYVSASQWKGNLRSTIRQMQNINRCENEDERMKRIFGNIRTEEEIENLHQAALRLYPTFFDMIDLEVINPHNRETGTGTKPIYLETVPVEASGRFQLLYFPMSCKGDENDISQIVDDFEVLAEGICEMMTLYGFGAKVSSGFGRVKNIEDGKLCMRVGDGIGERLGLDKGTDLALNFKSFEELKSIAHELSMKTGGRK